MKSIYSILIITLLKVLSVRVNGFNRDTLDTSNELDSLNFLFFGDWGVPGINLTDTVSSMNTLAQKKRVSFLVALGLKSMDCFSRWCTNYGKLLFLFLQEITFTWTA